jgi:Mu transposase, C-terminal domain
LPPRRYDTAYWEARQARWDAYVEVRGNRYSVPGAVAGRPVRVRIALDGSLSIYDGEACFVMVERPKKLGAPGVPMM